MNDGPRSSLEDNLGSSVRLTGCRLGAEGLATLSKAMTPTLASLDLEASTCADQGGDNLEGVLALCTALSMYDYSSGLVSLSLANNSLGRAAADALAQGLVRNRSLTHLDLHHNPLGRGAACALLCKQNAIMDF